MRRGQSICLFVTQRGIFMSPSLLCMRLQTGCLLGGAAKIWQVTGNRQRVDSPEAVRRVTCNRQRVIWGRGSIGFPHRVLGLYARSMAQLRRGGGGRSPGVWCNSHYCSCRQQQGVAVSLAVAGYRNHVDVRALGPTSCGSKSITRFV